MATLHQQAERFFIYIATSFLCAIVLVVPIIIIVILNTIGSKSPDPINFEPNVVPDEDLWNLMPLEEAIKKTKLESFEFTEKPESLYVDTVKKEKPKIIRAKIDPDMAPNCPTCQYTSVSKYFKFSKFGCPDFLNTPECCYCGRPTSSVKKRYPTTQLSWTTKTLLMEKWKSKRFESNGTIQFIKCITHTIDVEVALKSTNYLGSKMGNVMSL